MCGQGQFADLIEEDGAPVGYAEVAFALADGTGERPFLMSEEFAVDGSFGYGSAVDGEVFLAAAWRLVVNDPWDNLLTRSALSYDEYTEVGWRHLQCDVKGAVQSVAIADDIVPLLSLL